MKKTNPKVTSKLMGDETEAREFWKKFGEDAKLQLRKVLQRSPTKSRIGQRRKRHRKKVR